MLFRSRLLVRGLTQALFARLKISAIKALQDLPSEKRDGSEVAHSTYRQLISTDDRYVVVSLGYGRY